MNTSRERRASATWRSLFALLLAFAMLAAACGSDDDGGSEPAAEEPATEEPAEEPSEEPSEEPAEEPAEEPSEEPAEEPMDEPAEGEPQSGGTITISETFALSLDPAVGVTYGCCGGQTLVAIYDNLIAYNWDTSSYDMRTAESLTPNDDLTEWTLVLKPGIEFTDGNPYDAEAVVYNVNRHWEMPTSQDYPQLQTFLESVTAEDDLTVKFVLKQGWNEFPILLAGGTGMIASPAEIERLGENFGLEPGDMGAGPFKATGFIAHERTEMVRNDNYWDGEVYLDGMVSVATPASQSIADSITGGTIHGGGTVDWVHVAQANEAGYPYVDMFYPSGYVILFNGGTYVCAGGTPVGVCDGEADGTEVQMDTPTADPRVRKAVMHAIDRDLYNDRFYEGNAPMIDRVISPSFPYSPDVNSPEYNPDEAARLVDEAKADGWDGTIRLVGADDPNQITGQQTFAAMLEAVGMSPELDLRPGSEYRAVIQNERDFDVYAGSWGIGNSSDRFFTTMSRNAQNYVYGYDDPDMNAAFDAARVAATDEERLEAWTQVAEVFVRDNPLGFIGDAARHFIHSPDLHGLETTGNTIVRFDNAWLEQ